MCTVMAACQQNVHRDGCLPAEFENCFEVEFLRWLPASRIEMFLKPA
jgi:hypothetical protein